MTVIPVLPVILFTGSNPQDTKRLRLEEEAKKIKKALASGAQDLRFLAEGAVTADELRQLLLRYTPAVVHCSGHGEDGDETASGIKFENDRGMTHLVSAESLADLFKLFPHVQCLVLNACHSESVAEAISHHIPYVIGMRGSIGDKAALKFSEGFYDGLAHGRTFDDAFDLGCNCIELHDIAESLVPVLKKRPGAFPQSLCQMPNMQERPGLLSVPSRRQPTLDGNHPALSMPLLDPVSGRPRIQKSFVHISEVSSDMVAWSGIAVKDVVDLCWGQPTDGIVSQIAIRFVARYSRQKLLANGFLRLAVHGGVKLFEAQEVDLWPARCREAADTCLGVRHKYWLPTAVANSHPEAWQFATVGPLAMLEGEQADEQSPLPTQYKGDDLAATLEEYMDRWVLKRLDVLVEQVLDGRSVELLELNIHPEFIKSMTKIWPIWHQAIDSDPRLLRHMLASILTTAEKAKARADAAVLRAGPRTVETCLLPAVIFALSIEVALRSGLSPKMGRTPTNFELKAEDAHLVGLQLARGVALDQALSQLTWSTSYVLLAHERTPITSLRHGRRIGKPEDPLRTLTQPSIGNTTIITQDTHFRHLLAHKPSELREYLHEALEEMDQEFKEEAKRVIASVASRICA